LALANPFARFAICGMISQYNVTDAPTVPRNLTLLMTKRIRMQGYIVRDHEDRWDQFMADVTEWYSKGLIEQTETVHEGIEHALDAFHGLFTGSNLGICAYLHGWPFDGGAAKGGNRVRSTAGGLGDSRR
jgi:NADPH-dependent curcumin reductase CurA